MKIIEVDKIVASGTPTEFLAWDEDAPHMCITDHPVWRAAMAGLGVRHRERLKEAVDGIGVLAVGRELARVARDVPLGAVTNGTSQRRASKRCGRCCTHAMT